MPGGKGALWVCGVKSTWDQVSVETDWCPEAAWFEAVPLLKFSVIKISTHTQIENARNVHLFYFIVYFCFFTLGE